MSYVYKYGAYRQYSLPFFLYICSFCIEIFNMEDIEMSKKRYKKEKSFFDYSLKYRKQQTFRVKNEIRLFNIRNKSNYDFVSYDMTGNNEINYWSDICFLSRKDKNIFYNAEIVTCQCNLIERITNEAYDDVNSKLPEQCWYDYDRHAELGNMTIDECVQKYIGGCVENQTSNI